MDYWHTMHGGVSKRIKNNYFIDIFDYFIKYVGSSAYHAPGFMNLMPTIQFEYDLWYVEGDMYRLSEALKRLAEVYLIPVSRSPDLLLFCIRQVFLFNEQKKAGRMEGPDD